MLLIYHILILIRIYIMLKLLWYTISIVIISLILINSPSSSNIGNIGNSNTMFSVTRSNQVKLQQMIFIFIIVFLICTIFHVLYS
uniref:Probable protein-export membrane protein SecG n=1 Tax=Callithamnion tetricum TaxID=193179 RepID=A0A4D6WMC8_9FLOR|nr:Preprotein-translocase subunit g [Callithamnion tetricum]